MGFIMLILLFIVTIAAGIVLHKQNIPAGQKIAHFVVLPIIAIVMFANMITVVDSGTVRVVSLWGNIQPYVLTEGVNVINPFIASVATENTKQRNIKENLNVPSSEGLPVQVELSIMYRVKALGAPELYRNIGYNYEDIQVIPGIRSVVRGVTANFEAKALYTADRQTIAKDIESGLRAILDSNYFLVESALLRSVVLPDRLVKSIEEKLQAEQESQRMAFVLKKEEQEAERKRIEAKGIADFQAIVSEGINQNLLRWKGIEATEKLAGSANSKVVVIGSGKDGLPLILGNN